MCRSVAANRERDDSDTRSKPWPSTSRLAYTATVHVRLPVLGGKIENHIASKVPEQIAQTHRFTMAWTAESA